jgi:hypothetical protein
MKAPILMAAVAALGLAQVSLAGVAHADAPAAKAKSNCFFVRDWNNWHAPNKDTIYLRVGVREFYKVELNYGSQMLTWPDAHLINEVRGTDSVCYPIDLDLKVAEDGIVEPLFVKSIVKLTPEEVAAIPKKDLP